MLTRSWNIKKRYYLFILVFLAVALFFNHAKPDRIVMIKSPIKGLFYTVETYHGHGPMDSDFTRIYAHLERDAKSDKELVLDGEYLEGSTIIWNDPHNATICLKNGITDIFHNEIVLTTGSASETIHYHLQEQCDSKGRNP